MHWPRWIEDLKARYLADEGNVFVLHGAVSKPVFALDGQPADAAQVLVRFLKNSREVVGVLRPAPLPSRLEFADMSDRQRFENLIKAADLLEGRLRPLVETDPNQALARIWRALTTTGTDQAYLVTDTERLLPGHRRRVDPVPGAPDVLDWPTHPVLARSNNLVVFLCADPAGIRSELVDRSVLVAVAAEDARPAPRPALHHDAPVHDAPVHDAPVHDAPDHDADSPPPPPLRVDGEPGDLRDDLERALRGALATHPAEHRPAHLPVMAAVAAVIRARRPELWGALTFALDADGNPVISGPGAAAFDAAWRSDIALAASASMLCKELPPGPPGPLDATAVQALARRTAKLVDRL